jgi:pimeloyl-ACP methyl ester carboxylesterase
MTTRPGEVPQSPLDQTTTAPDGRTICFSEWGASDGAPVIWLHGTPGCRLPSRWWFELGFVDVLRSLGVRLITYDRPGYGQSDRQRDRRVADAAGDVAAVADAAGLKEFAVGGGSGGSPGALASAAILAGRVKRMAAIAPMAPYAELGPEEWSRGQDADIREYLGWVLEGEERLAIEVGRMDSEERATASPNDPAQASILERTSRGIWGWVDDELAVVKPWGFDPGTIAVAVQIWYDPEESQLPRQHGEWLARSIPNSSLIPTSALGHRQEEDPRQDWTRLIAWLAAQA